MIFRHNSNILIYDQETFLIIINVENINIFVETDAFYFSRFTYEYKVQKSSIYLQ